MPNRTSNTLTKIQSFMQKYISKSFNNQAAVGKCSQGGKEGARIFATPMPGACSFFVWGGHFCFKKDYTKLHITELSLSMLVDHSS